jgi:hypothetical protein
MKSRQRTCRHDQTAIRDTCEPCDRTLHRGSGCWDIRHRSVLVGEAGSRGRVVSTMAQKGEIIFDPMIPASWQPRGANLPQ